MPGHAEVALLAPDVGQKDPTGEPLLHESKYPVFADPALVVPNHRSIYGGARHDRRREWGGEVALKYIDFRVTGDPAMARATVERALTERGFKISWTDDWSGVAERGNKVANVLVGALAQYFKVGLRLMSEGQAQTVVRIERLSSGWAGGFIGASRTNRNFSNLKSELGATFAGAGVLVDVSES